MGNDDNRKNWSTILSKPITSVWNFFPLFPLNKMTMRLPKISQKTLTCDSTNWEQDIETVHFRFIINFGRYANYHDSLTLLCGFHCKTKFLKIRTRSIITYFSYIFGWCMLLWRAFLLLEYCPISSFGNKSHLLCLVTKSSYFFSKTPWLLFKIKKIRYKKGMWWESSLNFKHVSSFPVFSWRFTYYSNLRNYK